MEYTSETFQTSIVKDGYGYSYVEYGPFYIAMHDDDNIFYMPIEYKESLLARVRFYQEKIINDKYPVINPNGQFVFESGQSQAVLEQVLGLPSKMYYKIDKVSGRKIYLTPNEIISRIRFEKIPFIFDQDIKPNLNASILNSNDNLTIYAINYLAAHGFYFPNVELIAGFQLDNSFRYPSYIDESKIDSKYLDTDKLTGEKLLISFCSNLLSVTKDVFLSYYKSVDSLSLTELFNIAFRIPKERNKQYLEFQSALRKYFYAIMGRILDDYFVSFTKNKNIIRKSCLDLDFSNIVDTHPFYASGKKFRMIALDARHFIKTNEGMKQEIYSKDFAFPRSQIKKLSYAFDAIKKYFDNHQELSYLPALFVALLGLPYQAYNYVKFFDYKIGTAKQFIKLLNIYNDLGYEECYPLADEHGFIYPKNVLDFEIDDLFASYEGKGYYFSNKNLIMALTSGQPIYINADEKFLEKNKVLSALTKTSLYKTSVEQLAFNITFSEVDTDNLKKLKEFIMLDDNNGYLQTVTKFFSLMFKGYNSDEAYALSFDKQKSLTKMALLPLLSYVLLTFFRFGSKSSIKLIDKKTNLLEQYKKDCSYIGEEYYDDNLLLPYVCRGRNFLTFKKKKRDAIYYLDSNDRGALISLHNLFINRYKGKESFPISFEYYGISQIMQVKSSDNPYLDEAIFIGLPKQLIDTLDLSKEILPQLLFLKNVSPIYLEQYEKLIKNDKSLSRIAIFDYSIHNGILLLTSNLLSSPIIFNKINPILELYLPDELIKMYLIKRKELDSKYSKAINKLLRMSDRSFKNSFMDYLFGIKTKPDNKDDEKTYYELALEYGGIVNQLFYVNHERNLFLDDENVFVHHTLCYGYTDPINGNAFAATGVNFCGFSTDSFDFKLLKADREAFRHAIRYLESKDENYYTKNLKQRARRMILQLGVPNSMKAKLFNLLVKYKQLPDEEIDKLCSFDQVNIDFARVYSFNTFFSDRVVNISSPSNCTHLRVLAGREGMFINSSSNIYEDIPFMKDDGFLFDALPEMCDKIEIHVSDNISGTVKAILKPSLTTLSILLDKAMAIFSQNIKNKKLLVYLKEAIIHCYSKDNDFFVKTINTLHADAFTNYCSLIEKSLLDFDLEQIEKDINDVDVFSGIACFVLLLVREIFTLLLDDLDNELL